MWLINQGASRCPMEKHESLDTDKGSRTGRWEEPREDGATSAGRNDISVEKVRKTASSRRELCEAAIVK